jgi:hypothetical protein
VGQCTTVVIGALHSQLRPILVELERLGVGKGFAVLDRAAVNNVAHGELDDLAVPGARYVGDLHDLGRHVARRGVGTDLAVDLLDERLVQLAARAQLDEEDHAGVVLPFLADDEALLDFVELSRCWLMSVHSNC